LNQHLLSETHKVEGKIPSISPVLTSISSTRTIQMEADRKRKALEAFRKNRKIKAESKVEDSNGKSLDASKLSDGYLNTKPYSIREQPKPSPESPKSTLSSSPARSLMDLQELGCDYSSMSEHSGEYLTRYQYQPGMIIQATHVERDIDQGQAWGSNSSRTKDETVVFSKGRKYVVLKVYDGDHATVVPILTHGATGLKNKPCKNHYLSIREYDYMDFAAPAENDLPVLWADSVRKDGSQYNRMKDKTLVHFTNTREHKFCWPATLSGHLAPESYATLLQLHVKALCGMEIDADQINSPSRMSDISHSF
jgi:hypothetical protein